MMEEVVRGRGREEGEREKRGEGRRGEVGGIGKGESGNREEEHG